LKYRSAVGGGGVNRENEGADLKIKSWCETLCKRLSWNEPLWI